MRVSTLRPGLLVSLNTSIRGNVSYQKRDVEQDHVDENGERRAVWETVRTIADPAEHEVAIKMRAQIRSLITAHCAASLFGLLCPDTKADLLAKAIERGRDMANTFNECAKTTHIAVHVIAGRIASDDVDAVRAVNSEVRDLLTDMEQGIVKLDVEAVRDAANKARAIGSMLSPFAAEKVQRAIDVARGAAKRIVKAGENAAIEIDRVTLEEIRSSRTAFLDMEAMAEMEEPEAEGRAVDFSPMAPLAMAAMPMPSPQIDLM